MYAIIVTFNPDLNLLDQEYRSIVFQVDWMIYVDNSSKNKEEINNWASTKEKITLIQNDSNQGIGAAQNKGIRESMLRGAKHLILFDQDTVVEPDFVSRLYNAEQKAISEGLNVGLTGPIYTGYDGFMYPIYSVRKKKLIPIDKNSFEDYCKVSHIIASGCLIRSEVIKKVGLLRDDWFIGYIDFEYCFRAALSGYVTIVTKKACMQHLMGDRQKVLFGRKIGIYSPFRRYFDCRNTLLIQREDVFPKVIRHHYLKLILCKFAVSLIYGPQRLKQLRYCLRGFYDGLRRRTGKCPI